MSNWSVIVTLLQGSFKGMRKSLGSYFRSLLVIWSCPRAFRKKKTGKKAMQIHIYSHADPFWNTKYKYSRNIVKVYGEFIYFIGKFESPDNWQKGESNVCLIEPRFSLVHGDAFQVIAGDFWDSILLQLVLRGCSKHFGLEVLFATMSFEMLITNA